MGNNYVKNLYKAHCNKLTKTIKEAKKEFFHKQIAASSNMENHNKLYGKHQTHKYN
jgi:hypothetical protein